MRNLTKQEINALEGLCGWTVLSPSSALSPYNSNFKVTGWWRPLCGKWVCHKRATVRKLIKLRLATLTKIGPDVYAEVTQKGRNTLASIKLRELSDSINAEISKMIENSGPVYYTDEGVAKIAEAATKVWERAKTQPGFDDLVDRAYIFALEQGGYVEPGTFPKENSSET